MTVFNLEYCLLDSISRSTKFKHVGVYPSLNEVENAKQEIIKRESGREVRFEVYPVENLFEKITLS